MSGSGEQDRRRQELEELLPWLAAGTLNRRDAQRVEDALAKDPELARRYEIVREELVGTIHLNETLGAPSARAMEKLFEKIDAEPARARAANFDFSGRTASFLESLSPRALAFAATAAALVLILQSGVIGGMLMSGPAPVRYETASAPHAVSMTGAFVLVRFTPSASAQDVTTFLETNKASIVEGPLTGGFFRVRVSNNRLAPNALQSIASRMQSDKSVSFVAPTE